MLGATGAQGEQLIPAQGSGPVQARPGQKRLDTISEGTCSSTDIKIKGRVVLGSQEAEGTLATEAMKFRVGVCGP